MAEKQSLAIDEQALYEQEQGVVQMEDQIHAQEQGLAQMERAFLKKNRALIAFAAHVQEEEASLLRRADGMGPRAAQLVQKLLAKSQALDGFDLDIERAADRQRLLDQRREILQVRMSLLEEREQLYATRAEAIERADVSVADVEQKLVRRQTDISGAARQLFTAGVGDDDDEGEPEPELAPDHESESTPTAAELRRQTEATSPGFIPPRAAGSARQAESNGAGFGTPRAAGAPSAAPSASVAASSETAAIEERPQRKRTPRAKIRTNQYKIPVEVQLDGPGPGPDHFFVYENDGPDDLPGLFHATPNLLKVGREVRVRIGRSGRFVEAVGIVAWRRQRGEPGGDPGMGIELLKLTDADRILVVQWATDRPAQMI